MEVLSCNHQSVCSSISPTQMKTSLSSPFLHVSNRWHPWFLLCYFGTTRPRSKQSQTNCHTNVQTPAEGELHLETPGGGVGTHLRAFFWLKDVPESGNQAFSLQSHLSAQNPFFSHFQARPYIQIPFIFFLYLNLQGQIICPPHTLHPCKAGMSENKQKQRISGSTLLLTACTARSISDMTTISEKQSRSSGGLEDMTWWALPVQLGCLFAVIHLGELCLSARRSVVSLFLVDLQATLASPCVSVDPWLGRGWTQWCP